MSSTAPIHDDDDDDHHHHDTHPWWWWYLITQQPTRQWQRGQMMTMDDRTMMTAMTNNEDKQGQQWAMQFACLRQNCKLTFKFLCRQYEFLHTFFCPALRYLTPTMMSAAL
jgi:hypothetical protein